MPTLSSQDRALLEAPLPPLQQIRLPTGELIEYREAGRGDDAIVLLHGIGSSSAGYRAPLAGLSARWKVVAWNAPGFGGSTPPAAASPRVDDYVQSLHALLDALRLAPVHLVGSSWGSLIANAYAASHPQRVRSVVLSAPTRGYSHLEPAEKAARIAARLDPAARAVAPQTRAARFLGPDPDALVIERFSQLREAVHPDGLAQATRMLFDCDGIALAASVSAPALILAGTHDTVAPVSEHAGPLCDAMQEAELKTLDGCGHILKLEAPARFNQHLADFFQQT